MATKDWILTKLIVRRRSDYPFHVEGRNAETGGTFFWDVPAMGDRYDTKIRRSLEGDRRLSLSWN